MHISNVLILKKTPTCFGPYWSIIREYGCTKTVISNMQKDVEIAEV
jgi:hypothetical protein